MGNAMHTLDVLDSLVSKKGVSRKNLCKLSECVAVFMKGIIEKGKLSPNITLEPIYVMDKHFGSYGSQNYKIVLTSRRSKVIYQERNT